MQLTHRDSLPVFTVVCNGNLGSSRSGCSATMHGFGDITKPIRTLHHRPRQCIECVRAAPEGGYSGTARRSGCLHAARRLDRQTTQRRASLRTRQKARPMKNQMQDRLATKQMQRKTARWFHKDASELRRSVAPSEAAFTYCLR